MAWMIGIFIASNIVWIVLVLLQDNDWFKRCMRQNKMWSEYCRGMNQMWEECITTRLNRLESEIEKLRESNQEEGDLS